MKQSSFLIAFDLLDQTEDLNARVVYESVDIVPAEEKVDATEEIANFIKKSEIKVKNEQFCSELASSVFEGKSEDSPFQ
ncbi:TPA: hypothetical protein ACHWKL_001073 [Providencia stuartii]|uniref:hypothetical protein n=1 Tax=Providencia stuartii TaxID=588 RepID=UPI0011408E70|nr:MULTISPECIES: hypothetical protein [Providencia]MBN5560880.1 hypothetical protein [Providencia stuartii]MBN5599313.1 hypothetical protein [Providencia stuartii]MBN5603631.1 hypothetical protein [Providencia stuartii]MCL8323846.1 hypothetical protein [Providencia thailandensis]MDF4175363.1 hypothetical protein [Providencia thailandensis]